MTKDEALRLALEALEEPHPGIRTSFTDAITYREKVKQAITALKAALAQPEPVAIEHCLWARNGNTPCPHTTPPQRKWVWLTNGELADILKRGDVAEHDAEKGLWHVLPYQFAKAVEIKLKEKNT